MIAPGSIQHVISRFIDREFRFDLIGARDNYLARAGKLVARTDWSALAFALMSSHVHWALQAGERPSSAFIKPLHAGFAHWMNRREERLGPVFADRHRTLSFQTDTAAALVAYIHNNPVRAGVVTNPADSRWTSHRFYLGIDPVPPWLDVERGLHLCGFSATRAGRQAFHRFVRSRARDSKAAYLSGEDLLQRRKRARVALGAPVELASPEVALRGGLLEVGARAVVPPHCEPRPCWNGTANTVLQAVSEYTGIAPQQLRSRTRVREIVAARRLALVTWTHHLGRPTVQMARALGLADSSAAQLLLRASADVHRRAFEVATELREYDATNAQPDAASDSLA
jgi:hypothetical protein